MARCKGHSKTFDINGADINVTSIAAVTENSRALITVTHLRVVSIITAARPAYAGTEGCSILLVLFIFFLFNESP